MEPLTKAQLLELLARASDDYFKAAGETPASDPHRSYRCGLSDGLNIARIIAKSLAE